MNMIQCQGQGVEGLLLTPNYPWILWRIWSREIHRDMKQHMDDNYRFLSNLYISRLFYKYINSLAQPPIDVKVVRLFEVVHTTMLEEGSSTGNDYDKVVVNLKTFRTADSQKSENWSLTACKDLAGVLYDLLQVNDILIIWGGLVHAEQKTIALNLSITTESCPKTYMVIYRHAETSPVRNGHQQFHVPFNSRDVDHTYHILHKYQDSTVQKICPDMFPPFDLEQCIQSKTSQKKSSVETLAVPNNKSKEKTIAKINAVASTSIPSSKSKSTSQSSVSQIVHVDPEQEIEEIEEVDISSELNTTTSASVNGKPKRKDNVPNNPEKDKTPSGELHVVPLPLTRKNIRLHTSQSQDKSKKEVVEEFVLSEADNISTPKVTSPLQNPEPSPRKSPSPSLLPRSRTNSKNSPIKDAMPISNSHNSSELFSQDIDIQLESQFISYHNGVESSRNSKRNSPPKVSVAPVESQQSQYSTGRLLNELGNNESQELNGAEDSDGDCESVSTKEISPPLNVSPKKLCELTRGRVFHLKCRILKHHADPTENIVLLRVTDGTIPPFPTKILMPILPFQRSPDPNDKLLAALEVDVMIRNVDKLAKDFRAQTEEVLLTYVTIEKDSKNGNLRLFTMDGNRSEIQAVVQSQEHETSTGSIAENDRPVSSSSTPKKRSNDNNNGGFISPSKEKNTCNPNHAAADTESDDDVPLILRTKKNAKGPSRKLSFSSSTNKSPKIVRKNLQDFVLPSSQESMKMMDVSVRIKKLDPSVLSSKLGNSSDSVRITPRRGKHESNSKTNAAPASRSRRTTRREESESESGDSVWSRNSNPKPGPSRARAGSRELRTVKRKPTYVDPVYDPDSSDSESLELKTIKPNKGMHPQGKKRKL